MEAITKEEIKKKLASRIDPVAIECMNNMLEKTPMIGGIIKVSVSAYTDKLEKLTGMSRSTLFADQPRWMDIEESFRKVGWEVEFIKPAYFDSVEQHWEFS